MQVDPIFEKLKKAEEKFFTTEFFAPVFTERVRVQLANIFVDFKVEPDDYNGWGIFTTTAKEGVARFVRDASLREIAEYLEAFPRTTFVVVDNDRIPLGISASQDQFYTVDATPFFLADNIEKFETVTVRFDGANFIFERRVPRSAKIASTLRTALANKVEPKKLDVSGISKFERIAYSFVWELEKQKELQSTEGRIKAAVQRGGGIYQGYRRVAGNITVTYAIEGEVFQSTVSENLSVVSAGICLNSTDRQYDLQSLMSVIKEGKDRRVIHRFN